jgi:hypothetical protein
MTTQTKPLDHTERLKAMWAERHQLSHACDMAAYGVLGAARVLFRLLDPEMAKTGLETIADYDRHRKALEDFAKEMDAQEVAFKWTW